MRNVAQQRQQRMRRRASHCAHSHRNYRNLFARCGQRNFDGQPEFFGVVGAPDGWPQFVAEPRQPVRTTEPRYSRNPGHQPVPHGGEPDHRPSGNRYNGRRGGSRWFLGQSTRKEGALLNLSAEMKQTGFDQSTIKSQVQLNGNDLRYSPCELRLPPVYEHRASGKGWDRTPTYGLGSVHVRCRGAQQTEQNDMGMDHSSYLEPSERCTERRYVVGMGLRWQHAPERATTSD